MTRNRAVVWVIAGLLQGVSVLNPSQAATTATGEFDIVRFVISGNTLLPAQEVEGTLAPFVGQHKGFRDIQRALEKLEQAYRARGYGLVQVVLPEQDITKGIVQFRVVQPEVGRVTVEGSQHFDAKNIRRSLPAVREGETPNSAAIARNLQLVNEHPAKQTQVLLRGGAAEDQVDVTLKVTDEKPWRVILSLDNTGTSETGNWRSGIGFQHTNLFNRDHSLTAQYVTSPTERDIVNIYAFGYRAPYYRLNSSFDLIAGYSDVNSGVVQDLFSVSGSGTIFGARWNYYLPKWGELEQKLTAGLDYRAFRNHVIFTGTAQGLSDVTVHPVSLTYGGVLRMSGAELNFYGAASANIPGGSDGQDAHFAAARSGATADYTVLRYGVNYVQVFPNEWQGRLGASGQYTRDALVPGEQFGIGGPDTVRGYVLREVTSDRGYAAQFEVYTPNVLAMAGELAGYHVRLLGFYDVGSVKRNNALPDEGRGKYIASGGVGLRAAYGKSVSLRVDVAQIIKAAGTRKRNDRRVGVRLAVLY